MDLLNPLRTPAPECSTPYRCTSPPPGSTALLLSLGRHWHGGSTPLALLPKCHLGGDRYHPDKLCQGGGGGRRDWPWQPKPARAPIPGALQPAHRPATSAPCA